MDCAVTGLRWHQGDASPAYLPKEIVAAARAPRVTAHVLRRSADGARGLGTGGHVAAGTSEGHEVLGTLPPLFPEWLGDPGFAAAHGVRFPYIAGEMANGIAGTRLVIAMARADMLGFLGAGGLSMAVLERAVAQLSRELAGRANWGVNLLHAPSQPGHEDRVVDLLQQYRVPKVSASAFMDLTPAVVRCAVAGLTVDDSGAVRRRIHLFAKVSRPEVAEKFMSPAPEDLLRLLVEQGSITVDEARLAQRVPLASDITVEGDSGGHTDNRPLTVVLPAALALRESLARRYGHQERIRVGAAGGLGDPAGVAAAFACGADYVVTGTINQLSAEAELSPAAKELLAGADLADVAMAPAGDMFEYGVKVQVLRRGTLYPARAALLYDAYRAHENLEALPADLRSRIERELLRCSLQEAWAQTRAFWQERDPGQATRADTDARHRMALVFRSYLGRSVRWAIDGEPGREADYQIWCGPAIGAFNRWIAGSPLADPGNRTVAHIALNLLEGAAVATRAQQLRSYGIPVPRTGLHLPCHIS